MMMEEESNLVGHKDDVSDFSLLYLKNKYYFIRLRKLRKKMNQTMKSL
jgi:hypothetical protein